ncbi:oxidoreductase [Vibrio aquaticus]|uniref:Oxidoreductase n=2 Tax=Vibrio aquaticus TaxID=2496559 RepID=A0A432CTD3_9VIBR|nr:oxidoreductase [Vibrio aquaticus]
MLEAEPIEKIYALSRKPLPFFHSKLVTIQHPELQVHEWESDDVQPKYGFICLGTTLKQAGSKPALEHVDYELVCQVAQEMKLLGVTHLAVVSSLGASTRSFSHYLRCKGRMELALERLNFERLVIAHPGPLKGLRESPRKDEAVLQAVLRVVKPVMFGPLANFVPIDAEDVAKAMQYSLFSHATKKVEILDTVSMKALLNKYQ